MSRRRSCRSIDRDRAGAGRQSAFLSSDTLAVTVIEPAGAPAVDRVAVLPVPLIEPADAVL